jgi:uncharacterized protein (DUF58 family)
VSQRGAATGKGLVKPSTALIATLAGWLLMAFAARLIDALAWLQAPWFGLGALLALVAAWDLWQIWRERPDFDIARRFAAQWPVDRPVPIDLTVTSSTRRALALRIHELYPDRVNARDLPRALTLDPGEQATLRWFATARQRGDVELEHCHLAWRSALGLWWRRQTVSRPDRARVYPNFTLVIQYGRLSGDRRLDEMGIHLTRRRGTGSDFDQLRDYREGDSLRQIDWHATARMRKLIAKAYQEERDQRVVFLLDCSRRMRAMDGALSHFDQCLNALLLLAHVALKQGDTVALQTMGGGDHGERHVSPGRGQRQFAALLESVYDLRARTTYPDFLGATSDLLRRQRRRSLVVLLTNLRDEDHEELDPALTLLRRRHLVVLADLREHLDAEAASDAKGTNAIDNTLLEAGITLYREQRRAATRHLRHHGIVHLDVTPAELPGALVSQYRKLKASGVF